jgi:hypothetical protein
MESFQTLYTLAQSGAQDDTATTLPYLKADINRAIHILEGELDIPPLEEQRSITTTTSSIYSLPQNAVRVKDLYVTISSIRYSAQKIYDETTWQMIKSNTSQTSDYLTHVFIRPGDNQLEIYPTPANAGNTMTLIYESFSKDLSANDYTTGTITTLANGGTAITGSGTTFTSAMVGRWIKTTDNEWYKISAYTSATSIALKQAYQGTAISAGSATFTIGEMSRLPIQFQQTPVAYALWRHFIERRRDIAMAKVHERDWLAAKALAATYSTKHVSSIIPSVRRIRAQFGLRNPNFYPSDITQ